MTRDQIEARRARINATDVAAILGVSPYATAWDVWAEKVHGTIAPRDSAAMQIGTIAEPGLLRWACRELELAADPPSARYQHAASRGIVHATLDLLTADRDGEPYIVEAKTSGLASGTAPEGWGDAYTDEIPEHYLVQVLVQMHCSGVGRAAVACLMPSGPRIYMLHMTSELAALAVDVFAACEDFWRDHVVPARPPEDSRPSPDTLRRIRRKPDLVREIPRAVWQAYVDAKDAAKAAQEAADAAESELRRLLADACIVTVDGNEVGRYTLVSVRERIQTVRAYEYYRFTRKKEKEDT